MFNRCEPNALIERGFQGGSVVRIRMKNFLTFDECEVFTGPRLNIVIGPNGTGKSALTHAICLACCGSPGDIGRTNDLSKFVKHGKEGEESFVEVDILTKDKLIKTIRRVINSENRGSKWFFDGLPAKQSDVKAFVAGLSIDVDNLCSFMPQDKVGLFSRFTAKELLNNTLRSLHDAQQQYSLCEEQRVLSEIQDAKEEYRRKRDMKQIQLSTSKRELEGMHSEVERMQRREEHLQLLADYVVRLLVVELQESRQQYETQQVVVEAKEMALQEGRSQVALLEGQDSALRAQQPTLERAAEQASRMQLQIEESLQRKSDATALLIADVDTAGDSLILCARDRASRIVERRDTEMQLQQAHIEEQAARELLPGLREFETSVRWQLDEITERKVSLEERAGQLSDECGRAKGKISELTRELNNLRDFKQRYRITMRSSGLPLVQHAMQASEWLEANHERLLQSGQLRSTVLGPVALHCCVSDPACAVMMEKALPLSKLMGFVVDNEADARFIKHKFRNELHLSISVYTITNLNVDSRRPYSEELIARMRLRGYLSDQIECPATIRALFNCFHGLHRILWGRGADNLSTEQQARLCQVDGSFKVYLHDTTDPPRIHWDRQKMNVVEYRGTRSRNPQVPPSTCSVGVRSIGVLLSRVGDEDTVERRERLNRTLIATEDKLRRVERSLSTCQEALRIVSAEYTDKRADLKENLSAQKHHTTMQKRVEHFAQTLSHLDRKLSVDAQVEQRGKEAEYLHSVERLVSAVAGTVARIQKANRHRIERAAAVAMKKKLATSMQEVAAALKDAQRGIQALLRERNQVQRECEKVRGRVETKEGELNMIIEQSGLAPEEYVEQIYVPIVQRCPEDTVVATTVRIEQLQEAVNRIADNPHLQLRYEALTGEVRCLEHELQQAEKEVAYAECTLLERAAGWKRQVQEIAAALNVKFAHYMQDLQLGGAVRLKETGAFSDYEMQLCVRFRESAELTELDGSKHSCGESAVSTAMFLMALQDMTTSPFRVVDEINQGMDESNERLVFDRVVKSCCGDASKPQYFLVTPKLLQGLGAMRNDDVTVLLLWNGPGTTTKWSFAEVLQQLSLSATASTTSGVATCTTSEASSTELAGAKRHREKQEEFQEEEEGVKAVCTGTAGVRLQALVRRG